MRNLSFKTLCFGLLFLLFNGWEIQAQEIAENLSQEEKINLLIEFKTAMTRNDEIGDRYKIQLFSGDNGQANEVIRDYRSQYDYPSIITYEPPNYKVLIGNFRNRLEADRALLEVKKEFPAAFIPRPARR